MAFSVTPAAGTGLAQTFSYKASSAADNGYAYIMQMFALISSDGTVGNGCFVYYNRGQNYIYLAKDDGTWDYRRLGTPDSIHNSRCTLDTGVSTAVGNGNTLSLNLAIAFNPSWVGTRTTRELTRSTWPAIES